MVFQIIIYHKKYVTIGVVHPRSKLFYGFTVKHRNNRVVTCRFQLKYSFTFMKLLKKTNHINSMMTLHNNSSYFAPHR